MNARKLFYHKETRGDVIVEMVIWQLPENSVDRPHSLKYRFFCGTAETCFVRYDNETGKGDHRHYGSQEEDYPFQSIESWLTISATTASDCRTGSGDHETYRN